MFFYPSGKPSNDAYQVIENQMCSHRLFSMFKPDQDAVMQWLRSVNSGILTFDDYCRDNKAVLRSLNHDDEVARGALGNHGIAEKWMPKYEALKLLSERQPPKPPSHIMLDSGAFPAWTRGMTVTLDDVKRGYERFLREADGQFEIWLINLDEITDQDDGPQAVLRKIAVSDANLKALRQEFGDIVLPVFHQGEGDSRFLEVIDQAQGYLCLSPNNKLRERERWPWGRATRWELGFLECNVRTHGLAAVGNKMTRHAELYSGDAISWRANAANGLVELRREQPSFLRTKMDLPDGEEIGLFEHTQLRYQAYHIAQVRNDYDLLMAATLPDNPRHYTRLPRMEQNWVRERVEETVPFLRAQFESRARELVNLVEMRGFAESFEWHPPVAETLVGGKPPAKGTVFYHEPQAYPSQEDREWFLNFRRPGL